MRGFSAFLKSGDLSKKPKKSPVVAPATNLDTHEKTSRSPSFLASGDLRPQKKRSSQSSATLPPCSDINSHRSPNFAASNGSPNNTVVLRNVSEPPPDPVWMPPYQPQHSSKASRESAPSAADGRTATSHSNNSEQTANGAAVKRNPSTNGDRDGSGRQPSSSAANGSGAKINQEEHFSIASRAGADDARDLSVVSDPALVNALPRTRHRNATTTTTVAAQSTIAEAFTTHRVGVRDSHSDEDFSDHDHQPAGDTSTVVVGGGYGSVAVLTRGGSSMSVAAVAGDSVSQALPAASEAGSDGIRAAAPIFVQRTLAPYHPVPGDAESVHTPAIRYSFETASMSWVAQEVFLRVLHPNRGYDQDDLHVYFAVEQIVNANTRIPMVAKTFRCIIRDVREDDYFGEGECQAITESFCRQFNRLRPRPGEKKPTLPLLTCRTIVRILDHNIPLAHANDRSGFFSYRTGDTNDVLFMMEPNTIECMQSGVSFSSEMDVTSYPPLHVSKTAIKELAEAFSHFTLANSAEQMLVTGMQRYAGFLVDPLVYTVDHKGYGMANSGQKGIQSWREKHICNPVCRSIGLRPLEHEKDTPRTAEKKKDAAQRNFYVSLSSYVQDYREECVPKKDQVKEARATVAESKPGQEPLVGRAPIAIDAAGKAAPENPASAAHVDPVVAPKAPAAATVDATAPTPPTPTTTAPAPKPDKKRKTVAKKEPVAAPIDSKSGPPVTLTGYKYVFVAETQRWFPVEVTISVTNPDTPVFKDKHSRVYTVEQTVAGAVPAPMYARILNTEGAIDADYFNAMDAHVLCSTLAASFNKYRQKEIYKKFVHFMERHVVRLPPRGILDDDWSRSFFQNPSRDSRDILFILEPANFQAQYEHALEEYNMERIDVSMLDSDDEYSGSACQKQRESEDMRRSRALNETIEWKQVLETFYHFCYVRTGRYICVKDAQFANAVMPCGTPQEAKVADGSLTNPSIHTFDGNSFPGMNEGNSAVTAWVRGHKCNALCSLLGLPGVFANVAFNMAPNERGAAAAAAKKEAQLMAKLPRAVTTHYVYPATRFNFDSQTSRWVPSKIFIRVVDPDKGFSMGAMRMVFEVTECSSGPSHFETPYLAKVFRHSIADVVERDYFNEGALQNLCCEFGKRFSAAAAECQALKGRGDTTQLEFVPVSIVSMARDTLPDELFTQRKGFFSYKTKDTQKILFTIEEKIEGRFTKYNNNGAGIFLTSESKLTPQESRRRTHILEAAEALSHYSLSETAGALLVCDIQGVGTKLTDPEIHTYDGQGLGIGNRGREGMTDFVSRHRCNFVCKSLGLPPFNMRVPEVRHPSRSEWATRLQDIQNMPTSTEGHHQGSNRAGLKATA